MLDNIALGVYISGSSLALEGRGCLCPISQYYKGWPTGKGCIWQLKYGPDHHAPLSSRVLAGFAYVDVVVLLVGKKAQRFSTAMF